MKRMGKIGAIASLAVCMAGSLTMPLTAAETAPIAAEVKSGYKIGDDVGEVLDTDIQAFVQGKAIRSLNVDGHTAIIAADLRQYGFDVVWRPSERKVTITHRPGKTMDAPEVPPTPAPQVGTKRKEVRYTDIRAYYADKPITSYNIDGQTAILLKDLQDQGSVTWDEQARKVTFTAADNPSPGTSTVENVPLVIHTGQEIELKDIAFGSETITYNGQTIGTIVNGRPMISLAFMAQALGYRSVSVKPRAICFENGSYGVELFPYQASAEMRVALRWIGGGIGYVEVNAAPSNSADDVLIDERDLKRLFGYESEWNPETRKLQIRYIDYIVDDYGLPDDYRNYYYDLGAVGYLPLQAREMPQLLVRYRGNHSATITSASLEGQSGTYQDGGRSGLSKYRFRTSFEPSPRTSYDVYLKVGERILYKGLLGFPWSIQTVEPVIGYPEPFSSGKLSRLHFDEPVQGYVETNESEVQFSGKASVRVGSSLTVVVEKEIYGGGYETVEIREVPFDGDRFAFQVAPQDDDPRFLTRITVKSVLSNPRGQSLIDAARFYIKRPFKPITSPL
ncbi:hypothetical protein FE783_13575 [Paenibacillus mesophilus]|uniref:hypothetical protein n=1 Tax=Paenibacillus mesophilus TaxID=2582849 RepID=UPI00110D29A2|nr:hypothetical protein [Paenibacillus mesophilus]TMV49529.1 hypothetical protein FE783_13575 [Paenibacillus mesophilus]